MSEPREPNSREPAASLARRAAGSPRKKRLLLLLVYLGSVLALQEAFFRLAFPLPEIKNFNRFSFQVQPGEEAPSVFMRNMDLVWRSTLDTDERFVSHLNEYGFRDGPWKVAKPAGRTRIAFVGDSFVEGMMAKEDQVVSRQFARRAKGDGIDVEVMNMGAMGVGLQQYMDLIVDAVPIFSPDYVILLLYSNDVPFNEEVAPRPARKPERFNPFVPRVVELFSLASRGDPITPRWIRRFRSYFPAVPDPANPWTHDEAGLAPWVSPRVAEAMKQGNFNVFRIGWPLKEEEFLRRPADLREHLRFLRDYTREFGTKLFVFYAPSRHQVSRHYYQYEGEVCSFCPEDLDMTTEPYQVHRRMLAQACSDLAIPFRDLTPMIWLEESHGNHLYWDYDSHMRPEGYRMVGEAIFETWRSRTRG